MNKLRFVLSLLVAAFAASAAQARPTNTPVWTYTFTYTITVSPNYTATNTPTITLTGTPSPTSSITPSATPTITSTSTITPSVTPTSTRTPTFTVTQSHTITKTSTNSPSPTSTASVTQSFTITKTSTVTSTFSYSPTVSPTYTVTPSFTNTPQSINPVIQQMDIVRTSGTPLLTPGVLPVVNMLAVTWGAQALPTVPDFIRRDAPGYAYGACTTCTTGALFTAPVHAGNISLQAFACSVTAPTSSFGVGYTYLTPSPWNTLTVFNDASNTQSVYFDFQTGSTPATNLDIPSNQGASARYQLLPGASATFSPVPSTYFFFWCKWGPLVNGPFNVNYEFSNPYTGSTFPNQ